MSFFEEFDPGSGWTLAGCLTHASRTTLRGSGKRASNAYLTYPEVGNNYGDIANSQCSPHYEKMWGKDLSLLEGGASYQVVGEITAHQAYDG